MLGSAGRAALAVTAALALLGGCSIGGDDEPGPPAAQRTLEFPSCDGAFVPERSFLGAGWRRHSVHVGPLRLLDAARLADATPVRRRALVVRALFPPSRPITIGVEGTARLRVGFLPVGTQRWSGAPADLYPALLIRSCPELPPELGGSPAGRLYASALFMGVRRASCVPLLVTRDGGRTHRRVVSLGAGDCSGRAA